MKLRITKGLEHPKENARQMKTYDALVAKGRLKDDAAQREVLVKLLALSEELSAKRLFKKEIKGLYIWGNVGRGKSMLMDLFFQNAACV